MSDRVKFTEENAIIIDDSVNPPTYSLELHCKDAIEAADQREQILENKMIVEKINRVKRDTEALLNDSVLPNKDELERVVHLLEYLLDTKQSLETIENG